jgi:hypothetical protein
MKLTFITLTADGLRERAARSYAKALVIGDWSPSEVGRFMRTVRRLSRVTGIAVEQITNDVRDDAERIYIRACEAASGVRGGPMKLTLTADDGTEIWSASVTEEIAGRVENYLDDFEHEEEH